MEQLDCIGLPCPERALHVLRLEIAVRHGTGLQLLPSEDGHAAGDLACPLGGNAGGNGREVIVAKVETTRVLKGDERFRESDAPQQRLQVLWVVLPELEVGEELPTEPLALPREPSIVPCTTPERGVSSEKSWPIFRSHNTSWRIWRPRSKQ